MAGRRPGGLQKAPRRTAGECAAVAVFHYGAASHLTAFTITFSDLPRRSSWPGYRGPEQFRLNFGYVLNGCHVFRWSSNIRIRRNAAEVDESAHEEVLEADIVLEECQEVGRR